MNRRRPERGAILVEFALVATFLCLLAFGVTEIGSAWQDRLNVQTASRAGARVASGLTTDASADYETLLAVRSALQDIGPSNIQYVVVYRSATADGAVPVGCVSATGVVASSNTATAKCNAYTGAQVLAMTASQFGCGTGKLDNTWCPTTRQNLLSVGTDYLGVWIRVKRTNTTKVLGSGVTSITDSSVMRLEPLT